MHSRFFFFVCLFIFQELNVHYFLVIFFFHHFHCLPPVVKWKHIVVLVNLVQTSSNWLHKWYTMNVNLRNLSQSILSTSIQVVMKVEMFSQLFVLFYTLIFSMKSSTVRFWVRSIQLWFQELGSSACLEEGNMTNHFYPWITATYLDMFCVNVAYMLFQSCGSTKSL